MRKKKIGIALVILLVMAAVLSIRAHAADSPQTVIDADGSGTTISVTDITPREDKQNETKVLPGNIHRPHCQHSRRKQRMLFFPGRYRGDHHFEKRRIGV